MLQFIKGKNKLTITDIEKYINYSISNWKAFLWYFLERYTVTDFGNDWVEFNAHTEKQFAYLKKVIPDYSPDAAEHNYEADKSNNLWRTHRNTYWDTPIKILEKILECPQ